MRIACLYLPSFPLQAALVATGGADLHAQPVAVVSQTGGAPVVLACSRAAWGAGVRPTMTASVARALVPDLTCVRADVAGERDLLRAVADGLLALSPRVDLGGEPRGQHHVMYVEVPSGRRGTWFGARLLEILAAFGLRGRIGIADDRFTAYVAASAVRPESGDVVTVPRGGSAAYLAPFSLALLQLAPEVQHMLEALGVRTLGAFAALPPPSVTRSAAAWDADFQALARGDGGTAMEPYAPVGPIVERADLAAGGVGTAIDALARRLGHRLAGRGTPPELRVRLAGADGEVVHTLDLDDDAKADDLADAIGRLIGDDGWTEIEVVARLEPAGPVARIETAMPVAGAARSGERPVAAVAAEHPVEPAIAPLVLMPGLASSRAGERAEHRRTRRGKQRPRIAIGQARLFAGD